MSDTVLVNGVFDKRVAADDRGLLYGDGLFETCLAINGTVALWPRHMQRLLDGCRRLQLEPPDAGVLATELAQLTAGHERVVVRITITRGSGPRGYAPHGAQRPTRILSASGMPADADVWLPAAMRLRWCTTRLPIQPALAGIKHLNRLEQVLARAEWQYGDMDEGLLRSMDGSVVCATAANLFIVSGGRIITPPLGDNGVAGVMRAQLMDMVQVDEQVLVVDDVMQADELFLTNAVRGIMPVATLAGRHWVSGAVTAALMARCADQGLPPGAAH